MRRAVFLDRDGVINKPIIKNGKPYPPKKLEEFEFIEDVKETLVQLKKLGFILFIFTNQPDVARRTQTLEEIEKIHQYVYRQLPIDKIYCCYHDDIDNCNCRKPKPGMLLQAQREYDIDLKNSYVVGDRWRDIEAGKQANCKTFFIDYGYNEKLKSKPDEVISCLAQILKRELI